jgi:hypothetical protein
MLFFITQWTINSSLTPVLVCSLKGMSVDDILGAGFMEEEPDGEGEGTGTEDDDEDDADVDMDDDDDASFASVDELDGAFLKEIFPLLLLSSGLCRRGRRAYVGTVQAR